MKPIDFLIEEKYVFAKNSHDNENRDNCTKEISNVCEKNFLNIFQLL